MTKSDIDFQVEVTPNQVAFFNDNGYLSINRITTDDEIEWMKQIYDKLFQERTGEERGQYFDLGGPRAHTGREVLPQVLGPENQFPELRETIFFKNAHALTAKLLQIDKDNINGSGHMVLKPAKFGAETPWYQDEAYWNPSELPHRLSVWMPLDPATTTSGCMQFIPKSHKGNVRFHHHINNDPLIHGLVTNDLDPSQAVACPIPAAGATFHHCRTLHYAGPNTTIGVRRAYVLVLGSPSKRLKKPLARPWIEEEQKALAKPRNA